MERFKVSKIYGFKKYLVSMVFSFVLLLSLIIISVLFSPLNSKSYSFFPFLFSVILCALFFIAFSIRLIRFLYRYKSFINKNGKVKYIQFDKCNMNNSLIGKDNNKEIDVYLLANKYTEYCFDFNKNKAIKCFIIDDKKQKAVLYN